MLFPSYATPLAASYTDWNLVLGIFVGITTLVFAVLGVFLVRRIVQEDRTRRRLDDRLEEQAHDTRRVRDRLDRAPFARLSILAETLRRAGILVGDLGGTHAGKRHGRRSTYLEMEQGYAPFDAPAEIQMELAKGKTLEVRPADPRTVADAKREYAVGLKTIHALYRAAHHVARRNIALVEEIDALHSRIQVLKRSLLGAAVAFAALVALPLGLIVAVPTRPIYFHLADVSITTFTARMILLALFVSGTAATTGLLWRGLDKVDLNGLRYGLIHEHRTPRAFHEKLAVPDHRREARLRSLQEPVTPPPEAVPVPAPASPLARPVPSKGQPA